MIGRLVQPIPVAILALLLSIAGGGVWYWQKSDVLVARVLATRRQAKGEAVSVDTDRKAQGWDFWTIEMENLVNELQGEREQLRQKRSELDQRSARLDAERQELDRVRGDIDGMKQEIDQRVISIREDELKNLRKLAAMYATLEPASAVAIIREMDDVEAVKILSLMKADVTGPIFDTMAKTQPDGTSLAKRAAVLSEKLRLVKDKPVTAGP
jgi:flagellar motility protein MotE (MotC chaperone)